MESLRIILPVAGVVIGLAAIVVFFQMGSTLNRIETVVTHVLAELRHARKAREQKGNPPSGPSRGGQK